MTVISQSLLLSDLFFSLWLWSEQLRWYFIPIISAHIPLHPWCCSCIYMWMYFKEKRSVLWRKNLLERNVLNILEVCRKKFYTNDTIPFFFFFFSVESRSRLILALLKSEQMIIFLFNSGWLLSVEKGVGRKGQGTSLLLLSRHRI